MPVGMTDTVALPCSRSSTDTALPHAVEGYFTNGGKRLFVVRVVSESAGPSETYLFRGDSPVTVETRLAANAEVVFGR